MSMLASCLGNSDCDIVMETMLHRCDTLGCILKQVDGVMSRKVYRVWTGAWKHLWAAGNSREIVVVSECFLTKVGLMGLKGCVDQKEYIKRSSSMEVGLKGLVGLKQIALCVLRMKAVVNHVTVFYVDSSTFCI